MSDRDDDDLRSAARAWLAALDELETADPDGAADYSELLRRAEAATLARLRFHGALVAAGWQPPQHVPQSR